MTELENRLLIIVQRLEKTHLEHERQFGATLSDLTRQLNASAMQVTALSTHVNSLARRIEQLHAILTRRPPP